MNPTPLKDRQPVVSTIINLEDLFFKIAKAKNPKNSEIALDDFIQSLQTIREQHSDLSDFKITISSYSDSSHIGLDIVGQRPENDQEYQRRTNAEKRQKETKLKALQSQLQQTQAAIEAIQNPAATSKKTKRKP